MTLTLYRRSCTLPGMDKNEALQKLIDLLEKEKIENELEAGYKANFQYYLKSQKEWENADKE